MPLDINQLFASIIEQAPTVGVLLYLVYRLDQRIGQHVDALTRMLEMFVGECLNDNDKDTSE